MNKSFFLLVFLTCTSLFSQKKELGKVTVDELKQTAYPSDTSAVAAYLIKNCDVRFDYSETNGFSVLKTYRIKIKIYKKEGYEWANHSFSFYTGGSGKDKLVFSDAATYNLVNGKVEKTKLKSDGEFEEKINKYWSRKKITLPNVKEGSVIEYEVTLTSDRLNSIDEWYFQSSIPVAFSELKTLIPEYFVYNTVTTGFLTPKLEQEKKTKQITLTSKERQERGMAIQTNFSTETFSYVEQKTIFTLENIPALKDESFVNNIKNYTSGVKYELSSIQYPNQPFKNFTTDWETVARKIYDDPDFGSELNKNGYYENDLNTLLNGITSHEEKIATVFTYVKSRMNWDGFYGYSCNDGVRKAYIDKKGNVGEINLMLTSMLRYAGVEANPILLSTRSNGIAIFPSQSAFNYVICGVELQNQVVLLDATNKYALPNILPIRDLNWFGRIIRKNGSSSEINLMPTSNSKDVVNIMASLDTEGKVKGKVREQHFDYNAFLHRDNYAAIAKDSYIERMEKIHKGLEVEEYEVQNVNDLGKPVVENYTFSADGSVEIIGDKIYFSPFLFFALEENPFKQENREYPIDFVFPQQDKYNINIGIPDGYTVETLPQPKAVAMPDNLGSVKYNISVNGNQIQTLYSLDINQAIISNEYYDALKSFFKEIIAKQTEKIVLKKV
ncbi:DUF3857 domain-containing protein [Flavobacterium sp.]|uniref:DUF3857 domain-containing protein n=1 Tax=Flavobacterium sp. TaxID=239 RepID=UPI002FDD35C5